MFGGGIINTTEMKINRNFNAFTDFESLEFEVFTRYGVRFGTQGQTIGSWVLFIYDN